MKVSGAIEYWRWDGELGVTLICLNEGRVGRREGEKQSVLFIEYAVGGARIGLFLIFHLLACCFFPFKQLLDHLYF